MSDNSGPQAATTTTPLPSTSSSTTCVTTSSSSTTTTTASSTSIKADSKYDRLDINKLYKKNTVEPVANAVTQKHGMQTLGKAPPARRAGAIITTVKSEGSITSETPNSSAPQTPIATTGQPQQQPQGAGWTGPNPPLHHPHPSQSPHTHAPNVGPYPSPRFAQEFPSLASEESQSQKGITPASGPNQLSKDNQSYGPGPVLRPQTEGSWIRAGAQGPGGGGGPGPKDFPERGNLMGQINPPPPLGAYPMQYPGMGPPPHFMYPNTGPGGPGPGGFQQPHRYGMQVPPRTPQPPRQQQQQQHGDRGDRDREREDRMRPGSHFSSKSIIKPEDMERMNEIGGQDGGWASVSDDVDYNKKINFSDDEEDKNKDSDSSKNLKTDKNSSSKDSRISSKDGQSKRPIKILERQTSSNNENIDNERGGSGGRDRDAYNDRDRRRPRDDDWRSQSNRYDDDNSRAGSNTNVGKKQPQQQQQQPPQPLINNRIDSSSSRGAAPPSQDFPPTARSNLPPRFQKQFQNQQQQNIPQHISSSSNQQQRQTPSPKEHGGDWERERERNERDFHHRQHEHGSVKILERKRVDSESSRESGNIPSSNNRRYYDNDGKDQRRQPDYYQSKDKNKDGEYGSSSKSEVHQTDIKEDLKSISKSKTDFTKSWADEVDEVESDELALKRANEMLKYEQEKQAEEASKAPPKRVYIQQRKVEDMKSQKPAPNKQQQQQQQLASNDIRNNNSRAGDKYSEPRGWDSNRSDRNNLNSTSNNNRVVESGDLIRGSEERRSGNRGNTSSSYDKPTSQRKNQFDKDHNEKDKSESSHSHEQHHEKKNEIPKLDIPSESKEKNQQQEIDGKSRNKEKDIGRHEDASSKRGVGVGVGGKSPRNANKGSQDKLHGYGLERKRVDSESSRESGNISSSNNRRYYDNDMKDRRHQQQDYHQKDKFKDHHEYSSSSINKAELHHTDIKKDSSKFASKSKTDFGKGSTDEGENDEVVQKRANEITKYDQEQSTDESSKAPPKRVFIHQRKVEDMKPQKPAPNKQQQQQQQQQHPINEQRNKDRNNSGYSSSNYRGWNDTASSTSSSKIQNKSSGPPKEGIVRGTGERLSGGRGGNRDRGNAPSSNFEKPAGAGAGSQQKKNQFDKDHSEKDKLESSTSNEQHHEKKNEIPKTENQSETKDKNQESDGGGKSRSKEKDVRYEDSANKRGGGGAGGKSPRNANKVSQHKLHGYGPPSDKKPFGTFSKDDDDLGVNKEKTGEHSTTSTSSNTLPLNKNTTIPPGPIPLMALGELSPPDMPLRNRPQQQGKYGGRGGNVRDSRDNYRDGGGSGRGNDGGNRNTIPPRMQQQQSNRGGNKLRPNRDSAETAKPLMSINSTGNDCNQWESDNSVDNHSSGVEGKKSSKNNQMYTQFGNEKHHTQQQKAVGTKPNSSENNSGGGGGSSSSHHHQGGNLPNRSSGSTNLVGNVMDIDPFSSSVNVDESISDNSENNRDCDSDFQEVKSKKSNSGKDKGFGPIGKPSSSRTDNNNSNNKNSRPVRIKNPPYEAKGRGEREIAPRFLNKQQHSTSPEPPATSTPIGTFNKVESIMTSSTGSAWDKPIGSLSDQNNTINIQGLTSSIKDSKDSLQQFSASSTTSTKLNNVAAQVGNIINSSAGNNNSSLDGGNVPPVQTMIFENRNLKKPNNTNTNISSSNDNMKKDSTTSHLDSLDLLDKDLPLSFGKGVNAESPELDFGTSSFEDIPHSTVQSQSSSTFSTSKPISLVQATRSSFVNSHQPSPISPLAADLNEKIQSVKRVWDGPMPSLQEQNVCSPAAGGDNADNSTTSSSLHHHGGFDSFKSNEVVGVGRDYSLQQTSTFGSSNNNNSTISAIGKPISSTISTSVASNQNTISQQQQQIKSQQSMIDTHTSPFGGYTLQQQSNTFGGMPTPSPPTVMAYGTSQMGLPSYQVFPQHVQEQVMNAPGRTQYGGGGQYNNPVAGGNNYGISQMFLTSIDSPYQSLSYQPQQQQQQQQQQHLHHHQQGSQQQQVQQGALGQQQQQLSNSNNNQQSNRSPGPNTTTSSAGMILNSTSNSHHMSGMKQQIVSGNSNQNLSHQQQGYQQQQLNQQHHHHTGPLSAIGHPPPPPHMGNKANYSQGPITAQTPQQVFIPYQDPNQPSVMNMNQSYLSGGRGPQSSATPPIQLQSSNYYAPNQPQSGIYPTHQGGGSLQHSVLAVTPQTMNLQSAPQPPYGMQYQSLSMPGGYNSQAPAAVSAQVLNTVLRPGPAHSYMKPPSQIDMVQQSQMKSHADSTLLMHQQGGNWNTGYSSMGQGPGGQQVFGGNVNKGGLGNTGPRSKGNNQMSSNMSGGMKYMTNNSGYQQQQKGRFSAPPGPIQRPISTPPHNSHLSGGHAQIPHSSSSLMDPTGGNSASAGVGGSALKSTLENK